MGFINYSNCSVGGLESAAGYNLSIIWSEEGNYIKSSHSYKINYKAFPIRLKHFKKFLTVAEYTNNPLKSYQKLIECLEYASTMNVVLGGSTAKTGRIHKLISLVQDKVELFGGGKSDR